MSRIASVSLLVAMLSSVMAPLHAMTPPPAGGKVFVASCAVMFATKSSGTSTTRPGFGESRSSRNEASVSREFNIAGQDSTAYQRITDAICGGAPAELSAAGYEVVTAGVTEHYGYRKALTGAQESPQRQGQNGSSYLVFAPSGQKILDPFVVGGIGAANIGGGFTTIGKKLGANPVSLLYAVDFASIEAEQTRRGAGQNTARVTATLQGSVGLTVSNYDVSDARCAKGSPFGEFRDLEFCGLRKSQEDRVYSLPDSAERRTADPVVSVVENSGAAGAAVAAASAASMLLSMGRGGATNGSFKRFVVTVDPAKYEAAASEGARGLIAPAMRWINEPDSRPRGRR